MGIVSLKYDFIFKQIMLNEEVRKYFISDVLEIPVNAIRSVRLANSFLWKRYIRQKQGILDVKVELNDDSRVNIELQIRMLAHWDRPMDNWIRLLNAETEEELERRIRERKNMDILSVWLAAAADVESVE